MKKLFAANTDLLLVALVMGVLVVLFAPIPSMLLDVLLLLNFSLALLVLMMTFYAPRPVEFSTFPAILLIATLFRLALNVSATRLILSEGDAGRVIGAVGTYVVGGNYVIGLIVFLILVVVQYVVVTSGAQRVSEVAARFTLDSMPGQQMSIDADLNMGFIDQDEAKRRRKNLEREAAFYGSMDGASKFVKGDAIAGIVIMLINIVGGLIIGVLQQGMLWGEAMRHYTLLTIGDGIVTQIPALVISVGTGLIVTRSSSDGQLGGEVMRQLTAFPRTLMIVCAVLLGVAFLPGIPLAPTLVIAAGVGAAFLFSRSKAKAAAEPAGAAKETKDSDDPYAVFDVQAIDVEMGRTIAARLGGEQGVLVERIAAFRSQFAADVGMVIPKVRFRESAAVAEDAYRISLFGEMVASGKLMMDRTLAIHPSGDLRLVPGLETREPTYGLPALWIEDEQRDAARQSKYTLVDPTTVVFTHVSESIRQRAPELLTRAETERMLARLRTNQPGLVEELVPTVLTEPAAREGAGAQPAGHRRSAARRRACHQGPGAADRARARALGSQHLQCPEYRPQDPACADARPERRREPARPACRRRRAARPACPRRRAGAPGRQHRKNDEEQPDPGAAVHARTAPSDARDVRARSAAPARDLGVGGRAGLRTARLLDHCREMSAACPQPNDLQLH
jgi:flagellar biosynthesis protein FlhA